MLEGFEKINIRGSVPRVSIGSNGLNFNKNVVADMQKAEYVILLYNSQTKQLAIQQCDESMLDSVRFFQKDYNLKVGVRINYARVLQTVSNGWDFENYIYRAQGRYIPAEKAMIFDLGTAKRCRKRVNINKE